MKLRRCQRAQALDLAGALSPHPADCLLLHWRRWSWIPPDYRHCATFSDFWETYAEVFGHLGTHHQSVGKAEGETAHIERFNNTLRQRLARFVRRTLSFSKSDAFHQYALELFIHRYNAQLSVTA